MANCKLTEEKQLNRNGRGSMDNRVEDNNNIIAVRWYDNQAVTLLSSLTGLEPTAEARRWVKKDQEYQRFSMPAIVEAYNKNMGSIDLLNSFAAA
ncbi:hypothetical protein EB796_001938 [Bugula neritina]|uniref:PiggyBac transposable element-derived protein domain-containing protein n=1 Tax=Bugula neritina TaxID=10212 RepID=A0A7J7KNN9_BUGNE|nr:hypothetical protein EB796_001938 [Bugula neritina]